MSEIRGPVRHRRLPSRESDDTARTAVDTTLAVSRDLQTAFTALARRAKLPTGPGATPAAVLRAAGLPLLMATMVTGAQVLPAAAAVPPAPAAPQSAPDAWTVTSLSNPSDQQASPTAKPAATRPTVTKRFTAKPPAPSTSSQPSQPSQPRVTYTVRPGDTLQKIANLSGRSLSEIIKLNGLKPGQEVRPGQVLALPTPATGAVGARPTAPAKPLPLTRTPKTIPAKAPVKAVPVKAVPVKAPTTRSYVVREGDTLLGICDRHTVKLDKVLALNHLRRESIIRPGQRLLLPAPPVKAGSTNSFGGRTYPPAVVAAADANRRALVKVKTPTREQTKMMIIATARRHGVNPALALAVAYQESGFNQRVVSPANAVGVMQVTPSAGKWTSSLLGEPLDLLDPQDNITAGVTLLRALTKAADSEPQAIAGYYQGLASVRAKGMFNDTRRYVANVRTLKSRFAKTL